MRKTGTDKDEIVLDSGLRIALRRSDRTRRMVLRVARGDGGVTLSIPRRVPVGQARDFVITRSAWLARVMAQMPGAAVVAHGATFPVAGRALCITPADQRLVSIDGSRLLMPAARPPGPMLQAWLKQQARARLVPLCDDLAARLERRVEAVILRDTRSRWGSCNSEGRLMFSWRLAMAPPPVLDYVAAHEVAHLVVMDHSPAFWATVAGLMPDYRVHRGWLRQQGAELLRWRFRDENDN